MKELELDDIDKNLVNLMQADFPLTRQPFADIGSNLGLGEEEVIRRTASLKEAQIIRSIGAVIDSRSLGYRSTLVAMSVPENRLEGAADIVNRHPSVSHNYLRDDSFNMWFTLSVPPQADIESELKIISDEVMPVQMLNLPAVRRFKLDVLFDATSGGHKMKAEQVAERHQSTVSPDDKKVIDVLQQDLPLVSQPFDAMAEEAGVTIDDFLVHCSRLKESGVLRRFGASVRHRAVGYTANAMVCWVCPSDRIEEAGRIMASFAEVSHCYRRETRPGWRYNMYTMIHGRTEKELKATIEQISRETGIAEHKILPTVKELKKERVKLQPVTKR